MVFNSPLNCKKKQTRSVTFRGYEKLRDQWPYGNRTKAQWIKAFEEEASRTNLP